MFSRFRSSQHAARVHRLLPIALGAVLLALVPVAAQAARSSAHVSRLEGGQARLAAAAAAKKCRRHKRHCVRVRRVLASTTGWRAPTLRVSGKTLTWSRVGAASSYELATTIGNDRVHTAYAVVRGTAITPIPVPGKAVSYGVRVNVSGSPWSGEVKISFASTSASAPVPTPSATPPATPSPPPAPAPTPPPPPSPPPPPPPVAGVPVMTVQGQTISWAPLSGVSSYVLATTVGTDRTGTSYSTVSGTSVTPAAVAGQTVYYGLRANVNGSAWATEVSITYPAAPPPPPPPPPGPTSAFVKGMGMGIGGWGSQGPAVADQGKAMGATWDREDLAWSQTMPNSSTHDWSYFDGLVATARSKGITVLPILGYVPSWTTIDDTAGYAAFVKAAVQRYGPGTSANLTWFELWNEPYFNYTMPGGANAAKYARLYAAGAAAARQASPNVKLLIAADTAGTEGGSNWIDAMFTAVPGIGQYVDAISVHPYGVDPNVPASADDWSFQRVDTIRAKFLAHGVDKPQWITEIGWSTMDVSEQQQATNYAHMFAQVQSRLSFIRAIFPFCEREFESGTQQGSFGLLRFGTWSEKPAVSAIRAGYAQL